MSKKTLLRARIVYALLLLIGVGVISQIFWLQLFTSYDKEAGKTIFKEEDIDANRGSILARDGRFLATSVPYYQIRIDCLAPQLDTFRRYVGGLSQELYRFFGNKSAQAYEKELWAAREAGYRYKVLGNRDVDFQELSTIKQFPLFRLGANQGGIIAIQKNKRKNPYGRLAQRTVGFINGEGAGAGIENSYDFYLKGQPGKQVTKRLPGGERAPISNIPKVRPQDGFDVQTTLDIDIQEATESALRDQLAKSSVFEGATAVVMEVKTGAIRAIANLKRTQDGAYDESYNYAIGDATEPGSTFKLSTLIALLEGNYATLSTMVDAGNGKWNYGNHTFSDVTSVGYGNINVLKAFEKSSNVAFAQLAVKYFTGREKEYVERLYNMKLQEALEIKIFGEGKSIIRHPSDRLWSKLSLPMMSIGYEVLLTPMHTLTFYNAIANGGRMMKPYLIESLKLHGHVEKEFQPQVMSGAICSRSTIDSVHKALRYVVKEGTAKAIDDKRYQISGKTGTAQIAFDGKYIDQNGYRKHQASFAGFFPADNPRYTMVVVLYTHKTRENFYGGTWAAPVFKQIADKIYGFSNDWNEPVASHKTDLAAMPVTLPGNDGLTRELLGALSGSKKSSINKEVSAPQLFLEEASVPDVRGMGLRDAIYILERSGLKVKATGMGEVVAQSPPAGTPLHEVQQVEINLQKVQKNLRIASSQ